MKKEKVQLSQHVFINTGQKLLSRGNFYSSMRFRNECSIATRKEHDCTRNQYVYRGAETVILYEILMLRRE